MDASNYSYTEDRISWLAVACIILPIALGPFGAVPAIVCGHMARKRIKADPSLKGAGIALAGLIIAYVELPITLVFLFVGIVILVRLIIGYLPLALLWV